MSQAVSAKVPPFFLRLDCNSDLGSHQVAAASGSCCLVHLQLHHKYGFLVGGRLGPFSLSIRSLLMSLCCFTASYWWLSSCRADTLYSGRLPPCGTLKHGARFCSMFAPLACMLSSHDLACL